ncbi:MAG: hypothetical protein LBJ47_07265 [Tannerella sp.]|jgi:hypothetical protein|nr:hypothetical protein [Tannerella sp.]
MERIYIFTKRAREDLFDGLNPVVSYYGNRTDLFYENFGIGGDVNNIIAFVENYTR